ncbi:hypothetical protein LSTR_LSTR005914 [Laodelphax striatellus]|uniref:Uncharacterized protein n=1 Tax=Laodelphax striatellus TaxID=195883 RepID=A0A482WHR3_LAOST|nr:hypothetical protein LSTR_LSTR005914 [Laodelphax striatellus]
MEVVELAANGNGALAEDVDCKIVLVGDARCGKTSLVQRFMSDNFTESRCLSFLLAAADDDNTSAVIAEAARCCTKPSSDGCFGALNSEIYDYAKPKQPGNEAITKISLSRKLISSTISLLLLLQQ